MEGAVKMSISAVTSAITNLTTLAGSVLDFVAGNEVLMLMFGAGLVGTVIGVIHKVKHA